MAAARPSISVVIPTLDTWDLTAAAIASVAADRVAADRVAAEIVVVDDAGSTAPPADLGDVELVRRPTRGGFSRACNDGIRHSRGDVVLLLNSDATLRPGALRAALAAFDAEPQLGALGAALFYPDGTPQWSGGPEPSAPWLFVLAGDLARWRRGAPPSGHRSTAVAWVSGAAMALRRSMLQQIGLLIEEVEFYGQDVELCLRARAAGWRVRLEPRMQVEHQLGATIAADPQRLAMMWADLVRVVGRTRGPAAARRAAWAITAGAWIRALRPGVARPPRGTLLQAARRARGAARQASGTIPRLSEEPCS